MASNFTIRLATLDDTETITAHRRAMFQEMGYRDETAWFAVAPDASIAAGVGVWLMDWPPHMIGPGARRANILNVYTEPGSRRIGLARRLMQTALDWCRTNDIRAVISHSSDQGRAIYEALGFQPTNEMRLLL